MKLEVSKYADEPVETVLEKLKEESKIEEQQEVSKVIEIPKARRYNKGKLRYELIADRALRDLADVYTKGAHKYTIYRDVEGKEVKGADIPLSEVGNYEVVNDGSDNWRKGLPWMSTLGSVERHIASWKTGEDLDPELKTYHLANAAWGLFVLLESYRLHPELDDRPKIIQRKTALDLDEVVVNWVGAWCEKHNMEIPEDWYFHRDLPKRFEEMKATGELDKFYMDLKPLISPSEIKFDVDCYVTSRPVDSTVTEAWLDKHGFPARPVITVPVGQSKLSVLKERGIEYFIDDNYKTYCELNANGIVCFLMDAKHNRRFDIGFKRVLSFQDFYDRFIK
jgi:hypothetical protein